MSDLNAILAVGRDGFMARSQDDDMRWTGQTDKAIFKLLTSVGQVIGLSNRTADLLPPAGLPGRHIARLSRQPGHYTLEDFAENNPGAWLGGGYALTTAALELNLVRAVFICHLDRDCCGPKGRVAYPGALEDPTRLYLTGQTGLRLKWKLENTVHLGDVTVAIHRRG